MFLLNFIMVVASAVSGTSEPAVYSWQSIHFNSSLVLSQPQSIGLDAVSLAYPADASAGKATAELILVLASSDMQTAMEMSDTELFSYLKTTFLGLSGTSESSVERTILGRSVTGERHRHSIPVESAVEAYYVKLTNGDGLLIAFRVLPLMPKEDAEKWIGSVTESFKEKQKADPVQ